MRGTSRSASWATRSPSTAHFYQYEPPRDLKEIDADLDVLSGEIMEMLREVHS